MVVLARIVLKADSLGSIQSHVTCAGSVLEWPQPCVFALNFTEFHSIKAVSKYLNKNCMTLITLRMFCSDE